MTSAACLAGLTLRLFGKGGGKRRAVCIKVVAVVGVIFDEVSDRPMIVSIKVFRTCGFLYKSKVWRTRSMFQKEALGSVSLIYYFQFSQAMSSIGYLGQAHTNFWQLRILDRATALSSEVLADPVTWRLAGNLTRFNLSGEIPFGWPTTKANEGRQPYQ